MCKIEGCNNEKILAKGLCNKHYKQIYRHGKIIETIHDRNKIIILDNYAEIILKDKQFNEIARALIDLEDVDKVKEYKWCSNGYGYVICRELNASLHRFVMGYYDNDKVVDHINRNRLDNRKDNLRIATYQQNTSNRSIQSNNVSDVPGVSWRKDRNKWRAYIMVNKKQISLGLFNKKEDAIKARKEGELKYFGEFAPINNERKETGGYI